MIFALISAFFAIVAAVFLQKSRTARDTCLKAHASMRESMEFTDWATRTRIVVRDKENHYDVYQATIQTLYAQFLNGEAFRNAKLLHDHNDFKVYAQETPAELLKGK